MTLPSFATIEDLEAAGFQCPDAQEATHVLWAASTRVRREAGQTFVADDGDLIYAGSSDPKMQMAGELLQSVTIEAALRRLRNPEGATQRSEGLGPFTESVTMSADNVYLSREEKADVARAAELAYPSGGFPGLGTIPTTRGPLETAALCDDLSWDEWAGPPAGYPV